MAMLDWVVLGVLTISVVVGAWRGVVYEVLSLLAWVAAFGCARLLADGVSEVGPWHDWEPSLRYGAAFAVVFVAALFACSLLAWLGQRLARALGLQPADRALGALFGAIRAAVVIVLAAYVLLLTPLRTERWWGEAWTAKWMEEAVYFAAQWAPASLAQRLPVR
ncbi:CvpA family protein [Acidovorax lacteus]|uniref:CvpA family protein n=2 Tax=Acidovorax lacteus TaxID=1924988 RepID=A0ABP8L5J9_9BURK